METQVRDMIAHGCDNVIWYCSLETALKIRQNVGMTGPFDSILGRRKEDIIEKFLTNIPCRFNLAEGDVRMQGVLLKIDQDSGKAISINRVEYKQGV